MTNSARPELDAMLADVLHNLISSQDFCSQFIEWLVERGAVLSEQEAMVADALHDEVKYYYGPYSTGGPGPGQITEREVKAAVRTAVERLAAIEVEA